MSDKKYQVFISSTYTDLVQERKAVEETIIRAGDFPVGMEAFPAADEEQFEFIKTIIDRCDYYVLIIAGRYGSLAPDGLSYTEKEFHYAVEQNIPVLVLLHGDRGSLAMEKSETDSGLRDQLEKFIEIVSDGRLRKTWTTVDGLKLAVREALDHAKATKARPGWVRGDQQSSTETLEKLVALQQTNEKLKAQVQVQQTTARFKAPDNIAGLETELTLSGTYQAPRPDSHIRQKMAFNIQTSFGEIFELIAPHLLLSMTDELVNTTIAESVWSRKNSKNHDNAYFTTANEIFQTIKIQLTALNLVSVKAGKNTKGTPRLYWSITETGEQEMLVRRAITVD